MAGLFLKRAAAALGGWPDDYLSLDAETNGYAVKNADVYPIQVGYTPVWGRKPDPHDAVLIDWGRTLERREARVFYDSVDATYWRMADKGLACHITASVLRDQGSHPDDVWPAYAGLIVSSLEAGMPVLGHNIWHFDRVLYERVSLAYEPFTMPAHAVIDTGMLEVANQLDWGPPAGPGEMAGFYGDCRRHMSKAHWSLEHCCKLYGVDTESHRHHDAGYDSHVTHRVLEAMRDAAEAA